MGGNTTVQESKFVGERRQRFNELPGGTKTKTKMGRRKGKENTIARSLGAYRGGASLNSVKEEAQGLTLGREWKRK